MYFRSRKTDSVSDLGGHVLTLQTRRHMGAYPTSPPGSCAPFQREAENLHPDLLSMHCDDVARVNRSAGAVVYD